ncbi:IS21 family transposase ISCth15 [bioreactor metagenome]|uniref:IS21 family transposase ISCth15 n=1 Tax=bioreactor metagenome TaxID=1076179 RepID=A0A644YFM9_9ZZZZ
MNKQDRVLDLCRQMRLGAYVSEVYNTTEAQTHEEFLIKLLEGAVEARELERQNRYLRQADFDLYKTFEKFSFENIQLPEALTLDSLKRCNFLKEGHNLILYGVPGTGKTHLATALGVKACKQGHPVLYYKTSKLVNMLVDLKSANKLNTFWKKLKKAKLLILDEWGYIPFERTGTQLLFEAVSQCYEQRSIIVTTNLPFNEWNTIFYDEKLTNAMLDRLVHHGHLIIHNGPSYRFTHSLMQKPHLD